MDKKLFIVSADDDTDDQELIEEALHDVRPGHVLSKVGDGLKLLNFLHELSERKEKFPDLIFLDLNMPSVSGRDAIKILKASGSPFSTIPVVILTTSGAGEDRQHCFKSGADLYLVKPTSFSELKNVLQEAIVKFAS